MLDAGEDLAGLAADLYLAAKQLPGFFDRLARDDLADLDLELCEVIDGDLRKGFHVHDSRVCVPAIGFLRGICRFPACSLCLRPGHGGFGGTVSLSSAVCPLSCRICGTGFTALHLLRVELFDGCFHILGLQSLEEDLRLVGDMVSGGILPEGIHMIQAAFLSAQL